jgi:hypothetical protein
MVVPTQPRLRAFQDEKLEEHPIIMHWDTPFFVVISNVWFGSRPWTARHGAKVREYRCRYTTNPSSFRSDVGILSRMRAFVRRTYEERTQSGRAKYEYTDNDIAKSSWLLQGRAPKRRDSRLDRSWGNPDIDTEMPGLSGRICRAVDRNRAFALSRIATASVPSDSVYRFASFSRRQAGASFDPWRCRRRFQTGNKIN